MNRLRQLPWLRISAEGMAIVVSILLAFWIQAWWDGRQDRLEEREILSSLLLEFHDLKDTLEWSKGYNEAIRGSVRQLTNAALGPQHTLSDQDIDRLIADLWWNQELSSWSAPELSSVIASGDLTLVSNSTLRHHLGTWPIWLGHIRNTMQRDIDYFTNHQMPILSELTALGQVLNADDGVPGDPSTLYDGGRKITIANSISHGSVLQNRRFQNMLLERDQYITDILTLAFEGVAEKLDETITLLEQELAILAAD